MAPQKKVRKGKKKWHELLAPQEFNNALLGESYVYEAEDMIGTNVKANLMTLTNDIKKQSVSISFEVTKIKEGKGLTRATGYSLLPTMIKRFVRRGKDKIEDSFLVKTKDGIYARIKPMLITTNNCERSTQSALRKKVRIITRKYAAQKDFKEFLQDIVTQSFHKKIKTDCKILYPLKKVSIRAYYEVHLRHEVEIPIDSDDIIVKEEDENYDEEEEQQKTKEETQEEETKKDNEDDEEIEDEKVAEEETPNEKDTKDDNSLDKKEE